MGKKKICDGVCVVNFEGGREYWCEWMDEYEVREKDGKVIGFCRLKKKEIVVVDRNLK